HRIEKGLVMKPRKEIFAERFILETVECYKAAMQSTSLLAQEKKWATDVLEEYFQVVGSSKIIDKAREEYLSTESFREVIQLDTSEQFPSNGGKFSPYNHDLLPK